jgi:hypothetical protein
VNFASHGGCGGRSDGRGVRNGGRNGGRNNGRGPSSRYRNTDRPCYQICERVNHTVP